MTAAVDEQPVLDEQAELVLDAELVARVPQWIRPDLDELARLVAFPAEDGWQVDGACRNDPNPDRWFPPQGVTAQHARKVCGGCPVRLRCLVEAARDGERFGVWGAAIPSEIARVRAALGLDKRPGEHTDEACANGHEWTDDTLAYDANGRRSCRECNRITKRAERARARARAQGVVAGVVDGRRRSRGTA